MTHTATAPAAGLVDLGDVSTTAEAVLRSLLATTRMLLAPASVNVDDAARARAMTTQCELLVELGRRGVAL